MMNRGAGVVSAVRGSDTTTASTQTGANVTGTSVVLLTCHTHAAQSRSQRPSWRWYSCGIVPNINVAVMYRMYKANAG